MPPNEPVLLALPPTAASASVLRTLRLEGVPVNPVSDGIAGGLVLGARGDGAKRERECQRDECSYRTHVGASRA